MSYPEHEKLAKISDQSQACGEFLAWLIEEKKVHLMMWQDISVSDISVSDERALRWQGEQCQALFPFAYTTQNILAEFFDIDLKKLEDEKRAMLDSLKQGD